METCPDCGKEKPCPTARLRYFDATHEGYSDESYLDDHPSLKENKQKCGINMGTKPWWMGPDQYDPCPCVLDVDHKNDHECKHGIKENNYAIEATSIKDT